MDTYMILFVIGGISTCVFYVDIPTSHFHLGYPQGLHINDS